MVVNHPVYGHIEGTLEEITKALELFATMRTSSHASNKGVLKNGSAHDLYNKSDDSTKVKILRAFVAENWRDHKIVNHFSMPMLQADKPARITYSMYFERTKGKIPLDDDTLLARIADYMKTQSDFNKSAMARIVRWYNTTIIAGVVKPDYCAPLIETSPEIATV